MVEEIRKELERQVEQLRQRLNSLAAEKKDSLATEELVLLSQELDQVLLAWTNLKPSKE